MAHNRRKTLKEKGGIPTVMVGKKTVRAKRNQSESDEKKATGGPGKSKKGRGEASCASSLSPSTGNNRWEGDLI